MGMTVVRGGLIVELHSRSCLVLEFENSLLQFVVYFMELWSG